MITIGSKPIRRAGRDACQLVADIVTFRRRLGAQGTDVFWAEGAKEFPTSDHLMTELGWEKIPQDEFQRWHHSEANATLVVEPWTSQCIRSEVWCSSRNQRTRLSRELTLRLRGDIQSPGDAIAVDLRGRLVPVSPICTRWSYFHPEGYDVPTGRYAVSYVLINGYWRGYA